MSKRIDLTGQKFGRLKVLKFSHVNSKYSPYWLCRCECGKEKIINGADLRNKKIKSCGCLKREKVIERSKKHGDKNTKLYAIFQGIKQRCTNMNSQAYNNYGGRGIKCEWVTYEEFKKDMHDSYLEHIKEHGKKQTTIDRINNNGNYSKENCRWATYKEQANNRRSNRYITFNGRTKTMSQWADFLGIKEYNILYRLNKLNWNIEKALSVPIKKDNK